MRLPRYRAVLFDLDGTLVDSYDALTESINHARRSAQLSDLSRAKIQTLVGEGVETLLQRAFAPRRVPPEARSIFEAHYDEICCERSSLLDEVEHTVAALAKEGIRMAVCTNKPTAFSRKILTHLRIAHHFDAVAGPDLAGARKPDRRHVLFTLAATGVRAAEALFVGDMPLDVEAARKASLDVAVINSGSSSASALRASRPDFFLERFSELLDLVRDGAPAAR